MSIFSFQIDPDIWFEAPLLQVTREKKAAETVVLRGGVCLARGQPEFSPQHTGVIPALGVNPASLGVAPRHQRHKMVLRRLHSVKTTTLFDLFLGCQDALSLGGRFLQAFDPRAEAGTRL